MKKFFQIVILSLPIALGFLIGLNAKPNIGLPPQGNNPIQVQRVAKTPDLGVDLAKGEDRHTGSKSNTAVSVELTRESDSTTLAAGNPYKHYFEGDFPLNSEEFELLRSVHLGAYLAQAEIPSEGRDRSNWERLGSGKTENNPYAALTEDSRQASANELKASRLEREAARQRYLSENAP